jgi:hypothetical protein
MGVPGRDETSPSGVTIPGGKTGGWRKKRISRGRIAPKQGEKAGAHPPPLAGGEGIQDEFLLQKFRSWFPVRRQVGM